MCQLTSTMKRKILDAFFSDFFSRDFLSLILTRHRKNKKKIFNFSIYLENYLFLRDRTKRRLFDENEDLHLKLFACSDLLDENIILLLFLLLLFFLFLFFFFFLLLAFHLHFFSLSLSLLEKIRTQHVLRTSTIRNVDAFLLLDERAKIDRDVEAKTFERASRDIINTLIDVSFRRSLRSVDLQS